MNEQPSENSKNVMVLLSIMLFLQFWIWGGWYISLPAYIGAIDKDIGVMGASIYYCYGAMPMAAMIAPFFLGLIADRFFNTEKVLALLFLLCGVTMFSLPFIANLQRDGTVGHELLVDFDCDCLPAAVEIDDDRAERDGERDRADGYRQTGPFHHPGDD